MNHDSQTRMTNDEIRRNDQIPNDETGERTAQSISTFGLRFSSVIRHSSFNDFCKSGSWSQCALKIASGLSMNRPFGVPALAGPDRLKAGHRTAGTVHTGSGSHGMRQANGGFP